MRIIRLIIPAATVALAGAALYLLVLLPYRHNLMKKEIEREFDTLLAQSGGQSTKFSAAATIRGNVTRIRAALRTSPTDIDLHMELAAQYRFLGRYDDAAAAYEEALRFHRRPEIYRNLAESHLAAGRVKESIENYGFAVAFSPMEMNFVPPALMPDVTAAAQKVIAEEVSLTRSRG